MDALRANNQVGFREHDTQEPTGEAEDPVKADGLQATKATTLMKAIRLCVREGALLMPQVNKSEQVMELKIKKNLRHSD